MSPTSYQLLHPAIEKVEGEGFEPSKAEPTDLQSVPFGHSGTPPEVLPTNDIIYAPYQIVNNFFKLFLVFFIFILRRLPACPDTAPACVLRAAERYLPISHAVPDVLQFPDKTFLPDTDSQLPAPEG